MTLITDAFQELWLLKTSLEKCLKSRLSDDPSTDNVTNDLKHCCNLNDSTFTTFTSHRKGN